MTKDLELSRPSEIEQALVEGIALPQTDDPAFVSRAIVERILATKDVAEVFASFETTAAQDVLGVGLEVRGIRWQRSSFNEGPPIYAVLDAIRLDTGETTMITCSGRSVMAALFQLARLGSLPIKLKIMQAPNPTADGFRPLRLARV